MLRTSLIVRYGLLPITNLGLTAGAGILGMMVGTSIGLVAFTGKNADIATLVLVLTASSLFLAGVLWPMLWFQRMLFDSTPKQKTDTKIAMAAYCAFAFVTFLIGMDNDEFATFFLGCAVFVIFLHLYFNWRKFKI